MFAMDASKIGASIVLDLEDSIQIPHKPQHTAQLKKQTRENIVRIVSSGVEQLSIRINPPSSDEFLYDIAMLQRLSGYVWQYVLVPKCESADDIFAVVQTFESAEITTTSWIPIIETQEGVKNLRSLLGSIPSGLVEYIAFGYSDFNFDAGYFPFYHENSMLYWHWIDEITSIVHEAKYKYLHSPFLKIYDAKGLAIFLGQVAARCSEGFAQTTLSPRQSFLCAAFDKDPPFLPHTVNQEILSDDTYSFKECIAIAETIVSARERSKSEESLIMYGERLISPHEYLAAKRFLQNENAHNYGTKDNI